MGRALVGLGAAFAAVAWEFEACAVASLAIILAGVRGHLRAYDLRLRGRVGSPAVVPGVRSIPTGSTVVPSAG